MEKHVDGVICRYLSKSGDSKRPFMMTINDQIPVMLFTT
jgi:hypothetical protein